MKTVLFFLGSVAFAGALPTSSHAEDNPEKKVSEQLKFQPVTFAVPSLSEFSVMPPPLSGYLPSGSSMRRMRLPPPGRELRFSNSPQQRPANLLPEDPTPLLCQAYLAHTAVSVAVLKPEIALWRYPKCFFDLYVDSSRVRADCREANCDYRGPGIAVSKRGDISDETISKELFSLLVEGLTVPDDGIWYLQFEDRVNLDVYQREVNFIPDVVIEFAGSRNAGDKNPAGDLVGNGLTVELDLKRYHGIIQCDGKWGGYALDKYSCEAIENLLEGQLMLGRGQLCSFADDVPFGIP